MRRTVLALVTAAAVAVVGGAAEADPPRARAAVLTGSSSTGPRPFPADPQPSLSSRDHGFPRLHGLHGRHGRHAFARHHAFPGSFIVVKPHPGFVAPAAIDVGPSVTHVVPSYSAPLAGVSASTSLRAQSTPNVVYYAHGRYELRGDGVSAPYVWVWTPGPPPPPLDPATSPGS